MIDANHDQQKPFLISMCGPANAGKSQLAKTTARMLGEHAASRVPVDYFFIPCPEDMRRETFLLQPLQ